MALPAALLAAAPVAAKVPSAMKALYNSKYFIHLLVAAGILGSEYLGHKERKGELKLAKGKMDLESTLAKASAEATKKATEESRAKAKEYTEMLLKEKREERGQQRENLALQSFMASQDRQMALLMQAVQAMGNRNMGAATSSPVSSGMLGLMRSGS